YSRCMWAQSLTSQWLLSIPPSRLHSTNFNRYPSGCAFVRGRARNEIRIGARYYSESRRLRSSQNKEPDRSRWSELGSAGRPVGKDPPPPPPLPPRPLPPPPPPPPPPSSINRMPDNEGISPRESPPVTFTFYATL
ncbi:hypothetical protein ALC57_02489, partial [Trachymyrmex cornetzi]